MYVAFKYQRVPDFEFVRQNKKGRPHPALLYTYRRGDGFIELSTAKPYPKGGSVICCLVGDGWMLVGTSICSMSDTFSYQTGRDYALLRATNLGLGHELDSGLMFRLINFNKLEEYQKKIVLQAFAENHEKRLGFVPTTMYFHPETAKIIPEIEGFTIKTSKIILKNHVWIGFEE